MNLLCKLAITVRHCKLPVDPNKIPVGLRLPVCYTGHTPSTTIATEDAWILTDFRMTWVWSKTQRNNFAV